MIKNKFLLLSIFFVTSSCVASDEVNKLSPYEKALMERINRDDAFSKIQYDGDHEKYDGQIIKIYGYIDFDFNRIYLNELLFIRNSRVDMSQNILSAKLKNLHKDSAHLKKYCGDGMLMVEGMYKYKLIEGEIYHYLFEITQIGKYDETPFDQGGTGSLTICYKNNK